MKHLVILLVITLISHGCEVDDLLVYGKVDDISIEPDCFDGFIRDRYVFNVHQCRDLCLRNSDCHKIFYKRVGVNNIKCLLFSTLDTNSPGCIYQNQDGGTIEAIAKMHLTTFACNEGTSKTILQPSFEFS